MYLDVLLRVGDEIMPGITKFLCFLICQPSLMGGSMLVRATRKHLMPYDDSTLAFEVKL